MNNREIDRLIAEKVMEWEVIEYKNINTTVIDDGEFPYEIEEFKPSKDMADAWEVVEKLRKFRAFSIHDAWDEEDNLIYSARFLYADGAHVIEYQAYDKTAPLAICKAALKSVGVEVKQ